MSYFPTDNRTQYINPNRSRSFNMTISNSLVALTGHEGTGEVCGEVIIINKTGAVVEVYDQGFTASNNAILLDDNDSFTIQGITNVSQVSAQTQSGTGVLCYRTQFYSHNPSR